MKKWSRNCKVDAEIELIYSGSHMIKMVVHNLKINETGFDKNGKVFKGSVS